MIQFKSPRIEVEFEQLKEENPSLRRLLAHIQEYSILSFKKDIVITCLFRTPEENAELYKDAVQPEWRPHTFWMGADLRSSVFTDAELQKLVAQLNSIDTFRGQRSTASYHAVKNNVMHLHVQCPKNAFL